MEQPPKRKRRRKIRDTAEIHVGIGGLSPFPPRGPVTSLRVLGRGFEVALDPNKTEFVIGRDYPPAVDAHLPFRRVSQQHATITRQRDGLLVKDMGSRNGIGSWSPGGWSEYERVEELIAHVGSRFRVADIALHCLDDELQELVDLLTRYCQPDAHGDVDQLLTVVPYWCPVVLLTLWPERAEALARALHAGTAKRDRPFTVIAEVPTSSEAIDDLLTRADCGTVFLDLADRAELPRYFVERLLSEHYHLWPIITASSQELLYPAIGQHFTPGEGPTRGNRWNGHCTISLSPPPPPEPSLQEPLLTIANILKGDESRSSSIRPWEGWLGLCVLRALATQRRIQRRLEALIGSQSRFVSQFDPSSVVGPWAELPGWTFQAEDRALRAKHDDGDRLAIPWFNHTYSNGSFASFSRRPELHPWALGERVKALVLGPLAADETVWSAVDYSARVVENVAAPSTSFPEGRLWRWIPSAAVIRWSTNQAFGTKIIRYRDDGTKLEYGGAPTLGGLEFLDLVEPLIDAVDAIDFTDARVQATWARAFGDDEVGGTPADAAAVRRRHRDWLDALVRAPAPDADHRESQPDRIALLGLVAGLLDGAELVWAYDAMIESDDFAAGFALDRLRHQPDLPRSSGVPALLRRLSPPEGDVGAVLSATRYLFERGYELELAREKLVEFANAELDPIRSMAFSYPGELAIALLEHVPEAAPPVARAALRDENKPAVTRVAAALVAIGAAWCRTELLAAYGEAVPCWQVIRVALGRLGAVPPGGPHGTRNGLDVPQDDWNDFDSVLQSLSGIRWPSFDEG
jgi:hypothetical protein